ncbi:NAD-dependent epimerase/dehydratase family protein [Sphingobium sp. V4]|uniref:NAD-dependent epimerase/dehydratase family protein n=1 Tax=Sphingobium sp. V4 TaxID=3038927 RepID=UPI002557CECF|nr:NAD-dependent epimerase/dehydratase family protein [Sphingobium sp. V4]WIW89510.1 NAD-dependent epimerase/dehydratase family protein [Sphingobium sp. V4]
MAQTRKALIVGCGGMVGRAAIDHFAASPDWLALGMARRPLEQPTENMRFLRGDLLDRDSLIEALKGHDRIEQIVYAALFEEPDIVAGWSSKHQIETNLLMLTNLLDALDIVGVEFGHLSLIQGGKAYGIQFSPPKMPARESDPPFFAPNFYFEQENLVRARSSERDWEFTVLRPQLLCGIGIGNAMNCVAGLGVYAAICQELGQPLRFPGGVPCFQQATDARLLARAIYWAGHEPRCAGETYNIANGDIFSWPFIWPLLAKEFDVEVGIHQPFPLASVMPDHADAWDRIVRKHGLADIAYEQIVPSWQFIDFALRHGSVTPQHSILSTIKARTHGFQDCIDTEEMLRAQFAEMRARKWLPH